MSQHEKSKSDLNSLTEKELIEKLKINPRLARRIISLRPFHTFDQLNQIWGIDTRVIKLIKDEFTLKQEIDLPEFESINEETLENQSNNQQIETPEDEIPLPDYLSEGQISPTPENDAIPPKIEEGSVQKTSFFKKPSTLILIILLIGAIFRFSGLNWDDGSHQHPDERYLTMVAESIRGVDSISAYFDTATSTLNPLNHGSYTYGMFPLFVTRMVAEWVNMTSYDTITLVGRFLSGLFDLGAIWMLYILAKRLYNPIIGLIAAALAAVTVLPIQLSHFFAVDSFSTVFVVASFYFLLLAIPLDKPELRVKNENLKYFAYFGFTVGLAGACKINTLPVLGLIFFAAVIYLVIIRREDRFVHALGKILLGLLLAIIFALIAFRVFQPYAFAGPAITDLTINKRWFEVIKEVTNQVAGNSEWPPNHHWTNRPVQYAWINMVLWGMGIPLGLAAWLGWGWAGIRIWKGDWRKHLFPFVWILAYFIWQNVQFWRYMRYFVPIYPFLILFAAWALVELITKYKERWDRIRALGKNISQQWSELKINWKGFASVVLLVIVLLGTFSYAFAFSRIYTRPHTRIQASRWIISNIEGPINVKVETDFGIQSYPIPVYNNRVVESGQIEIFDLKLKSSGITSTISAPLVKRIGGTIYFRISRDELGEDRVTDGRMILSDVDQISTNTVNFGDVTLEAGQTYYFYYHVRNSNILSFSDTKLRNENPDEPQVLLDFVVDKQNPGSIENTVQFTPDQTLRINRFEINNLMQDFLPSSTTLKVSILKDRDEPNPLVVSEISLDFNEPGLQKKFLLISIKPN